MTTIPELWREHVSLEVECVDRVYRNGYVPKRQTSGALVYGWERHRGDWIASPVSLGRMGQAFVGAVEAWARAPAIPLVHCRQGQRQDDLVAQYRRKFRAPEGGVVIGVAHEQVYSFKARKETFGRTGVRFQFWRQSVFVKVSYFYRQDAAFGPGFIKVAPSMPDPVKGCLNGHEWAQQQRRPAGVALEALDTGFLRCAAPERLQAVCQALGPEPVQACLENWVEHLPWPLTDPDRTAGDRHRLCIGQMEVSRTPVLTRPVRGRAFCAHVLRENLDLGRPDRVQRILGRSIRHNTPSRFLTRVIQAGVQPQRHLTYPVVCPAGNRRASGKHSAVKQDFQDNRALRTETTINNPWDLRVNKDLAHWPDLRPLARAIHQRRLPTERVSPDCLLSAESLARVSEPTPPADGQRAPGLRFGQPRGRALWAALSRFAPALNGFRHGALRPIVQAVLNVAPDA
jgi:hypothetical protein